MTFRLPIPIHAKRNQKLKQWKRIIMLELHNRVLKVEEIVKNIIMQQE